MIRLLGTAALVAASLSATPALAQSSADEARFAAAQARLDSELQIFRQEFDRYQSLRGSRGGYAPPPPPVNNGPYRVAPDPYVTPGYDPAYDDRDEGSYDPARYYRVGPNYRERTMTTSERVYAGDDGRYYCKRNDGTTGLVVGAVGGAILGNVIDGGHSRGVGTILGAVVGGAAGRAVDQNNQEIRCR